MDVMSYILVSVPVEARLFEDKPVFSPLLGEVAFSILLLPQPAFTVPMAKVLTGNSPTTSTGEGTCRSRRYCASGLLIYSKMCYRT